MEVNEERWAGMGRAGGWGRGVGGKEDGKGRGGELKQE